MAQGDYIELHQKRQGKRFDHAERERKKEARSGHKQSAIAKKVRGIKAKQLNKKRYAEKAEMKKTWRVQACGGDAGEDGGGRWRRRGAKIGG